MDAIRNPTPVGLALSLLLLLIPLAWPITMYMWLRYLTGHRGDAAGADERPRTAGMDRLALPRPTSRR